MIWDAEKAEGADLQELYIVFYPQFPLLPRPIEGYGVALKNSLQRS